jgi:hypothetical protein
MTRVSIERIGVDAACVDPRDAESFRERLRHELSLLLEKGGVPESMSSASRADGGELHLSPGSDLPRAVAEQVVQFLGGKS